MGHQYQTPLSCIECQQHIFQTEEPIETAMDLAGATCANCGHALTEHHILTELKTIPDEAITKMLEDAAEIQRRPNSP